MCGALPGPKSQSKHAVSVGMFALTTGKAVWLMVLSQELDFESMGWRSLPGTAFILEVLKQTCLLGYFRFHETNRLPEAAIEAL